jgi:glycosyltransferase involved in cell wall biosynthesis
MTLRIAFNGQRLAGQRLGIGRYIEYLLRHWATSLAADEEVSVFVRRPIHEDLRNLHPRIRPVMLSSRLWGIPWENIQLRRAAAAYDVLFCPGYTAPIGFSGKTVVASHSADDPSLHLPGWLRRRTYFYIKAHSARHAARVIVPSSSVRDGVVRDYGAAPENVVIIPQGADDAFQPVTDQALLSATRRRYFGTDRPYMLFVGKLNKRRNIAMLVRAFAQLKATRKIPHGLLLFGPESEDLGLPDLCRELGVTGDVVQTDGKVEHHSELVAVYAAADVYVHPSELEGWSLTVVEAMACGTAVVVANRGGLVEVTQGHALLVSDLSVDGLAAAIGSVL